MSVTKIINQAIKSGATELDLSKKGITRLPSKIGQLSNLMSLNLNNNKLSTLPPEIGQLAYLQLLDVSNNQLSNLPMEIGQLANLTKFDLSENQLSRLPELPDFDKLNALVWLDLSDNELNTWPLGIEELANLQSLDLSENKLSILPSEIGELTNLTTLLLSNNQLGALPPELRELTNLTTLDLRNNLFLIPPEILSRLNEPATIMAYYYNTMIEPDHIYDHRYDHNYIFYFLMQRLGNLCEKEMLKYFDSIDQFIKDSKDPKDPKDPENQLDISSMNLIEFPIEISKIDALMGLGLSDNEISILPSEIGQLTNLTRLYLSHNKLRTLPLEIQRLRKLTTLDLRHNLLPIPPDILQRINKPSAIIKYYQKLIKKIKKARKDAVKEFDLSKKGFTRLPPEIGNLTNLTSLNLYENQLRGLLPEIGNLTNLTSLNLHDNELKRLPPEIELLTNITKFDISNNQLYTLLPEIGQLTKLTSLDVSNNQLCTLPPEIGQLTKLASLDVSNNQLRTLPSEIEQLTNLTSLNLQNNPLPIPPEILERIDEPTTIIRYYRKFIEIFVKTRKDGLTELDLSKKRLTRLPPEIGQLTNLTKLNLYKNQLETLPREIRQLANLTTLVLAENKLSTLPLQIGELIHLRTLYLYDNQLKTLPQQIAQLTNLKTLYLYENQLKTLPSQIGQLTNLTTFELSGNQLSTLPSEIGELTNLARLYLTDNQLKTLPPEIGQLTNLITLDLRNNQLRTLPPEISQLTNLTRLDLCDNQLPIPPDILVQIDEPATILKYYNQIIDIFRQARKDEVTRLDLSGNQLEILSLEIGQLTNLTTLDLSNNKLNTLPPEIGQLTNLTTLNLHDNELETLLSEIGQLTRLTTLELYNNRLPIPSEILNQKDQPATIIKYYQLLRVIEQASKDKATALDLSEMNLTRLPPQIGQLINLTTLDLHNNQLETLPPEIGQLTNLTTLDLSTNQLSKLPAQMGQLTKLTRLDLRNNLLPLASEILEQTDEPATIIEDYKIIEIVEQAIKDELTELDLSKKELTTLSPKISQLTNLTRLDLASNKLSTLPLEISLLTSLTRLDLAYNQFSTLPSEIGQLTNLTALDLEGNQLSKLPLEIGGLSHLTSLTLSNNQLETLPLGIRQLTNLTELDLRGNRLPVPPEVLERTNEPAIIIEYCLRQQAKPLNEAKLVLVGQGYVGKTSLVKRLIEGQFDKDEPITEGINIKPWSVAINDEQIKLNIWDFGGQEIMHATHQFFLTPRTLYLLVLDARQGKVSSRLDYWLDLIDGFAGNSPIIIVSNKIDQHPLALNRRKLREKYPSIKPFVDTSCETGHGIAELKRHITAIIDKLEHVRDLIPPEWLEIKSELEGRQENYIAYSEYIRLCKAYYIRDKQQQRILIRLLHDLGVVLHFEDDPQLRNIIVLNPEWITGAVYKIINAKPLQNKGVLGIEQLDEILDADIYPKEKYLLIIEMMRRFERCFDLEGYVGEKFLLPDLLPIQGPSLDFWPSDSLDFEYHYNFLPHALISRFMVQMHGFIFGDNYWLTGVVLVKNKNNALVKAVPEEKKMAISVIGPQQGRRKFLTDIRLKFELIHQTISNLDVVEHVVYEQVAIQYSHLGTLHKQGVKDYYFLDRNGELVIANVPELLDSVKYEFSEQEDTAIKGILEQLRQQLHPQLFYSSALSLGRAHYKVGQYSLARQALAVTHQALRAWRGMESNYEAHVKLAIESAQLYQMLVHCCVEEQNDVRAFEYAAVGKGRAFINKLAEARLDFEAIGDQEGFAEKVKQARELRSKIDKRQKEAPESKEDENRRGELYKLFQEEIELWQEMEQEHPRLTATLAVPTISAAQARDLTKELGATLVEYYRHGSNSTSGWCAFVVTGDEIRYVSLPKLNKRLLKRLLKWRNTVHLPAGRSPFMDKWLAKLYDAAIAPLDLKEERVIIAPFEHLHLLPLAAAYNRNSKHYLAQDHLLSFVPSLTALYVSKQDASRKERDLSEKSIERLLSVAYPGLPEQKNYLPNVLDEANAIVQRVSNVAEVDKLHQEAATPKNVVEKAPNYDVIHFGCHGNFNSQNPTKSGLILAEKALTVQDIITSLNLKQTRLATLAACLTGQVALRQGEEHIGLLQAMMTAGVQTVVASLWLVDDTATRALFTAFYTREVNINAPAQAMRDAATLLREDEEWKEKWAHPYYWAAFQVNGLTLPVELITEAEWGIEMREQIKDDYQRSIQRGPSMNDQLFIENAELLLENMLSDDEMLAVLKEQPLPNEIAQLPIEHTPLGVADAIHYIVLHNPTLRERLLPPSVKDIKQIKEQLRKLRGRVTEKIQKETANAPDWQKEGPGVGNKVSTVRKGLIETLEEPLLPSRLDEQDEQAEEGWWERFVNRLFGR